MKTVSKSRIVLSIIGLFFSVCIHSQVPVYNSYPSATPTIYLDFDGEYVDGTSWNYNGPLTLGPSNLTNDQITEIFKRVSEDYRPFTINVTTDSTKYWSAPVDQRTRVIFTTTSSWYGNGAGGVSYIGSFTWGDNTPCFVFTALLKYRTKWIAEAGAHEAGHTLGLNHQSSWDANCVKLNDYNYGTGTGEIGWAPIMGSGYYQNFTLWHNGSNPWGCANFQDDLSIITGNGNGVSYRTDDYSGTTNGTTTQASFLNNQFSVSGIIEKIDDKDAFKFTMPINGHFHLDANPYSVSSGDNGSDLDVQLELLSSNKTVLGTYNPDLLLSATIDTTLNSGTYYIRVESSGNIYAPDYASLGSYTLTASYAPVTALPVHRLELNGINENDVHQLNWIIDADETVVQQTLEVSANGENFQPLGPLTPKARSYSYVPTQNSVLYYRLKVNFDNGKQYYSNILALRNAAKKPSIKNSLVRNSIEINSPAAFRYTIVDYSGRTVSKGSLVQGMNIVSTASLVNGMYIVQFTNGQQQYADKLMKQ